LDPQVVWQRARLGAESNKPRVVSQAVAMLNPDWAISASAVLAKPDKYLDEKLTAVRHRTKELVTLALVRLAATDPAEAADQMARTRWRAQLTQEEKSWIWGTIGRAAAQRLMPEATDWFAKGTPGDMHAEHLAWWVRSALRAGRWEQVAKAIQAMPEGMRQEPTWTYWYARALTQLKTPDAQAQARAQFQRIANPNHFYGQLALEELGQAIVTPPAPPPVTPAEQQQARNVPGLRRALKAMELGLRSEGVREWNYETNLHTPGGMPERELLAAAQLACQREVWDRCINTSERTTTVADYTQRFPTPHLDAVLRQTTAIGLDPAYVYGLIRQESRFVVEAKSQVGASGLMQVMPATARWTAKKIGMTDFKPGDIHQRDTNIAIGSGYLKLVLDNFEGSMPLAAAAYNAGPGRARRWRAPSDGTGPVLEGAIWAENIPFSETRDYVKRVLSNTTNYAALLSGQPQSLKARLGRVGPGTGSGLADNEELP
jgi:soluble lytic murein transglycosylase